jgi:hypothetical protein
MVVFRSNSRQIILGSRDELRASIFKQSVILCSSKYVKVESSYNYAWFESMSQ